ncbi:MAG: hypothetical protein COT24_05045 [Candidatus Kerfeldbacteria bacterium CG08_land_8_20_14_0_20_40_16]|uniref:GIY-YIG domain-containing protein n=1 Tax=Candidatus Kerfeldbacteria bacterium CG08_land_8_20_14_0_20_40_16 TaxID=2014244 RepID=A0A2H0YUH8_9BACT|nr:MAG: hypothetical protein COT24_05045 [Candidatus Kerfeldbacteria bacterium CG08_land_8_20_14_0_20_40_16]
MYFVYVSKSKRDNSLYIGQTSDLQKRVKEHNQGKTKSLKHKTPLYLIYYEVYKNKKDATRREWNFKHKGQEREILKKQIHNSINNPPPSSSG